MNRTDRLLAIVLELQGKGWQRAADLAHTFETSKRTIYRDLEALGQAGVPIVAISGRGYSLVEGYFLPPLAFSAEEATLLLLGSDVMAQSFDEHYREAAEAAGRKIAGALPAATRTAVQDLRARIQFIPEQHQAHDREGAKLQHLRRALLERRTVRFTYHTRFRLPESERQPAPESLVQERLADPHGLAHVNGAWYLVAFDHDRCGQRRFRLDRIDELELTDRSFILLTTSAPLRAAGSDHGSLVVRVCFDATVARWVRESPSYFTVAEEVVPEGLLVTLHVRQEDEILQWLLSWGQHVVVLEPASLRQRILAEARAMLARADDPQACPEP